MSTFIINKPLTWQAKRSESVRESLIDSMAEKAGVSGAEMRDGVANCARFVKAQGNDETPTMARGVAGPAVVRGQRYDLVEEHRNGHGDRVLEAVRPIGGGRFERIRIRESQAELHSYVVSEVRGGR